MLYLIAACLLGLLIPELDARRGVEAATGTGIGTARDILSATATGMIAFTGFVVASVLVVVQFAAGQYSPRLVLWFRRDALVKHAIGAFLAVFVYALVALRQIEGGAAGFSPDITVAVALALLVGACVLFLALLQRVTDRLRPRTLFAAVLREGIKAARETYPLRLGDDAPADRSWASDDPQRVVLRTRAGVVTSFDRSALVAVATRSGAVIELVSAVGEFVDERGELMHVHGGRADPGSLDGLVRVADERTIEQDPAFAMRIVVDLTIRALSPAINDPTTAVQGLDVLGVLVRELAGRDLEASLARDAAGDVRLVWRSPSWEDVLDLAFDEITALRRRLDPDLPSSARPPRRSPHRDAREASRCDRGAAAAARRRRAWARSRPARPSSRRRWPPTERAWVSRALSLRRPTGRSRARATGRSAPTARRRRPARRPSTRACGRCRRRSS